MQLPAVSIKEFRSNLSTYFNKAVYKGEPVVVAKYQDVGVFISKEDFDEYQQLRDPWMRMSQAEWDAHFAAMDEIRAQIPQYPPEEVERDIAEALAEVRAQPNKHT